MRTASLLAIASLAGCQITVPAPQESFSSMPRLMSRVVANDQASASATRRLHDKLPTDDEDCGAGADQAIELVADVAAPAGAETILASFANGIVVLDREGQLVASTNGYRCDGSIDEIEVVAAGDAFGDPTIVIVAKTGGRREYTTFVGLFRIGFGKQLDRVFTATVEEHAGSDVRRGAVYMLPNGLVYRLPDGRYSLHVFDPVGRFYLVPGDPLDDPEHEPPLEEAGPTSLDNT